MDPVNIASVLVALIAALAAYASQRAAAKASTTNSRTDMEREAYERARKFDTDTIERQDAEIAELRAEIQQLRAEIDQLRNEKRNTNTIELRSTTE